MGIHMGVSKNRFFSPKSSILIGFSIINHPFWGIPIFGNTHMWRQKIHEKVAAVGIFHLWSSHHPPAGSCLRALQPWSSLWSKGEPNRWREC